MASQAVSPSFAAAYAQSAYVSTDPKRLSAGLMWAVLLHLVVGYLVLSGRANEVIKVIQKPLQAVVIQEVLLPPPPPPLPPPVQVPPPKPQPPTVVDTPKPVIPTPVVQTPLVAPATPATTRAEPVAPPSPVVQAAPEAPVQKAAPVVTPPPPVAQVPQAPSLEGEYVGKLRSTIDAAKRYPTGRQASQQRPQGSVKLWFVLTRAGVLVDVGVFPGDAPFILEDAAKAAVRRSSFPAFPPSVWPGEEQHKFTTELNFVPPSGS
jgi:protein TonB